MIEFLSELGNQIRINGMDYEKRIVYFYYGQYQMEMRVDDKKIKAVLDDRIEDYLAAEAANVETNLAEMIMGVWDKANKK